MSLAAALISSGLHSGISPASLTVLAIALFCALVLQTIVFARQARQQARALQEKPAQLGREIVAPSKALQLEIAERQKAEDALRDLSGRLLRLQDDERRRIARELHDSTSQNLVAVSMNIAYLQAEASANARTRAILQDCASLVEQCSTEIRTISYLLHPPVLDELGLAAALEWAATGFSRRSGIAVQVEVPEKLDRFSPDVELAMFRIVQEALTNIHRHSRSRTATITACHDADGLTVSIVDQGRGLPEHLLRPAPVSRLGVGIAGMRERIRQLGGCLQIRSSASGTQITACVPVAEPASSREEAEAGPRAASARCAG